MIPDFASMNRIDYRPLSAVYISDMKFHKTDDAATWKYFEEGNFGRIKIKIPYSGIGRDHCKQQENKKKECQGSPVTAPSLLFDCSHPFADLHENDEQWRS